MVDPGTTLVNGIISSLSVVIPHILHAIFNLLTFTPADYPNQTKQLLYNTQVLVLIFSIIGIAAVMYVKYKMSYKLFQRIHETNVLDDEYLLPDTDSSNSGIFNTQRASVGAVLFAFLTVSTAYFVRYDSVVFESIVSFVTVAPPPAFSPESIITAFSSFNSTSPTYVIIFILLTTFTLGGFGMVLVIAILKSMLLGLSIIIAPLAVGSRIMHIPAPIRSGFRLFTHVSVITTAMLLTLNAVFFFVGVADIKKGSQTIGGLMIVLPLLLLGSALLGSKTFRAIWKSDVESMPVPRAPPEK